MIRDGPAVCVYVTTLNSTEVFVTLQVVNIVCDRARVSSWMETTQHLSSSARTTCSSVIMRCARRCELEIFIRSTHSAASDRSDDSDTS